MRVVNTFVAVSLLALAAAEAGCSSDDSASPKGNNGHLDVAKGTVGAGGGASGASGHAGASGQAGGASGTAGAGGSAGGGGGPGGDAGAGGTDAAGGAAGSAGSGGEVTAGPDDIVVETLNVALAGLGVPHEAERRPVIFDRVADSDADVVCLAEIWQEADKTAMEAAATAKGKHTSFVHITTDDATPVDDPTDLDGNTPPAPGIACSGAAQKSLDDALACIEMKCDTQPGSDQGHVTDLGCAQTMCAGAAASLLGNHPCYGCLAPQLASEKLADIKSTCETSTNPGLGFAGQNGVMMLSKHPLTNPEMYVLPSTWIRRVVLKATMQGPKGPVDVYCNHLSAIFTGGFYPYTGPYGASGPSATSPPNGWENEIFLQGKKLVAFVSQKSAGPAIIAGDFNAGPVVTDSSGATSVAPTCVDTYSEITAAFPEALSPGYAPVCTYCSENVNVPAGDKTTYTPQWIDHVFLKGFADGATKLTERTFLDPIVPAQDASGAAIMTQISDHYGLRVIVTQPSP